MSSTTYRETTVTIFGVAEVVRTERTGTVAKLEREHMAAVKAVLTTRYAAHSDAEKSAAKARMEAESRELHARVRMFDYSDEAREIRGRAYGLSLTAESVGKHKFTVSHPKRLPGIPPVRYNLDPASVASGYDHVTYEEIPMF
jgi:hypothetical protein